MKALKLLIIIIFLKLKKKNQTFIVWNYLIVHIFARKLLNQK